MKTTLILAALGGAATLALAQAAYDLVTSDPLGLSLPGVAYSGTNAVYTADGQAFTAYAQNAFSYAPGTVALKWNALNDTNIAGFCVYFGPVGSTNWLTLRARKDVTRALFCGLPTDQGDWLLWMAATNAAGREIIKSDALIFHPY